LQAEFTQTDNIKTKVNLYNKKKTKKINLYRDIKQKKVLNLMFKTSTFHQHTNQPGSTWRFCDIRISHGNAAMQFSRGEIFIDYFAANCPKRTSVTEF